MKSPLLTLLVCLWSSDVLAQATLGSIACSPDDEREPAIATTAAGVDVVAFMRETSIDTGLNVYVATQSGVQLSSPIPLPLPPAQTCPTPPTSHNYRAGDPALAVAPDGLVYVVASVFDQNSTNGFYKWDENGIGLWSFNPTTQALNWIQWVSYSAANPCDGAGFLDKPSISIAGTAGGFRLNIAWVRYDLMKDSMGQRNQNNYFNDKIQMRLFCMSSGMGTVTTPVIDYDHPGQACNETGPCWFGSPQLFESSNGFRYLLYVDYYEGKVKIAKSGTVFCSNSPMLWTTTSVAAATATPQLLKRFCPVSAQCDDPLDYRLKGAVTAYTIAVARLDSAGRRIHVTWHQVASSVRGPCVVDPYVECFSDTAVSYANYDTAPSGPTADVGWLAPRQLAAPALEPGHATQSQFMPALALGSGDLRVGITYYNGFTDGAGLPYKTYVNWLQLRQDGTVQSEQGPSPVETIIASEATHTKFGDYQDLSFFGGRFRSVFVRTNSQTLAAGNVWIYTFYAPPLMPSALHLAPAFYSGGYSANFDAMAGGQPPSSWSLVSGTLPPGMTLSGSGLLSGASSAPGTYSFRVNRDSCCVSDVTLAVSPDNATVVSTSIPPVMLHGEYTRITVTVRNTGSTTWRAADGYVLQAESPTGTIRWGRPGYVALKTCTGDPCFVQIVPPGTTVTFTYYALAPNVSGVYDMQWRMAKNGVGFGDATSVASVTVY